MYGVSDKYIKLQEYPFSSEQKLMAVKCVNKYDDVSIQNTYCIIHCMLAYTVGVIFMKLNCTGERRSVFCQGCIRESFETMYKIL